MTKEKLSRKILAKTADRGGIIGALATAILAAATAYASYMIVENQPRDHVTADNPARETEMASHLRTIRAQVENNRWAWIYGSSYGPPDGMQIGPDFNLRKYMENQAAERQTLINTIISEYDRVAQAALFSPNITERDLRTLYDAGKIPRYENYYLNDYLSNFIDDRAFLPQHSINGAFRACQTEIMSKPNFVRSTVSARLIAVCAQERNYNHLPLHYGLITLGVAGAGLAGTFAAKAGASSWQKKDDEKKAKAAEAQKQAAAAAAQAALQPPAPAPTPAAVDQYVKVNMPKIRGV